jgi:hypothetical protein
MEACGAAPRGDSWVVAWKAARRSAAEATQTSGASFAPGVGTKPVTDKPKAGDKGVEATVDDPIAFSTKNLDVVVTKHVGSPAKDGDYLLANAKKCGPKYRPASYFPEVVATLKKLPKTTYTIRKGDGAYLVTFIPNLIGYKDLDSVQADFFSCPDDRGKLKAVAETEAWLVFTQSCADSDTDCREIAEVVNPTIKIK